MHLNIPVGSDIFDSNRRHANRNQKLFENHGIAAFNVMGAIGSGKTTLIELAIERLGDKYQIGVVAGDIVADIDASRFESHNVPTVAMNTGKECHLDAHLVDHAIKDLPLADLDLVFIENVGNLICPTDFELGEHRRVVIVSVSEGDDIVAKHPMIFLSSDIVVVNKVDIAEFVGADPDKMVDDATTINPKITTLKTSAKTGEGIDAWIGWIEACLRDCRVNS